MARGQTIVRETASEGAELICDLASFIERNNSSSLGSELLAPPSGGKRLCTSFPTLGIVIMWTLKNVQIKYDRKKHQLHVHHNV